MYPEAGPVERFGKVLLIDNKTWATDLEGKRVCRVAQVQQASLVLFTIHVSTLEPLALAV